MELRQSGGQEKVNQAINIIVDHCRQGHDNLRDTRATGKASQKELSDYLKMLPDLQGIINILKEECRDDKDIIHSNLIRLEADLRSQLRRFSGSAIDWQENGRTANYSDSMILMMVECRKLWYNWFCIKCLLFLFGPKDPWEYESANAATLLNGIVDYILRHDSQSDLGLCIWDLLSGKTPSLPQNIRLANGLARPSLLATPSQSAKFKDDIAGPVAGQVREFLESETRYLQNSGSSHIFFPVILLAKAARSRPYVRHKFENPIVSDICNVVLGFAPKGGSAYLADVMWDIDDDSLDAFGWCMFVSRKWLLNKLQSHAAGNRHSEELGSKELPHGVSSEFVNKAQSGSSTCESNPISQTTFRKRRTPGTEIVAEKDPLDARHIFKAPRR